MTGPREREDWWDPSVDLGSSTLVRVVTNDEDPDFEPLPFLGFAAVDERQRVRTAITQLQADAAPVVAELREFEERRCRLLCCPVNGLHDRRHPSCSQGPLLWEGDQT